MKTDRCVIERGEPGLVIRMPDGRRGAVLEPEDVPGVQRGWRVAPEVACAFETRIRRGEVAVPRGYLDAPIRQYWGETSGNRAILVAQAVCKRASNWTQQLVVVKDGQDCVIALTYDVEARELTE